MSSFAEVVDGDFTVEDVAEWLRTCVHPELGVASGGAQGYSSVSPKYVMMRKIQATGKEKFMRKQLQLLDEYVDLIFVLFYIGVIEYF